MFKKAFTLIEMLIVMAVVAILVAIIIPSYRGMQDEAWLVKAEKELQTVQVALESYFRHNNTYPEKLDDLLNPPAGPRIITKGLQDPWNSNSDKAIPAANRSTQITYGYIVDNSAYNKGYYVIYSWSKDGARNFSVSGTGTNLKVEVAADSDDVIFTNILLEKLSGS